MAYTNEDRRNHIRELQRYLYSLSFYDETMPQVVPDGIYGRETALAVRAFQQKKWSASKWRDKPCYLGCHCCTIPQTNRTAASKTICIRNQSGDIRRRRNRFPGIGVTEHIENPATAISKYRRIAADWHL